MVPPPPRGGAGGGGGGRGGGGGGGGGGPRGAGAPGGAALGLAAVESKPSAGKRQVQEWDARATRRETEAALSWAMDELMAGWGRGLAWDSGPDGRLTVVTWGSRARLDRWAWGTY
jgi:hypothetical protein